MTGERVFEAPVLIEVMEEGVNCDRYGGSMCTRSSRA